MLPTPLVFAFVAFHFPSSFCLIFNFFHPILFNVYIRMQPFICQVWYLLFCHVFLIKIAECVIMGVKPFIILQKLHEDQFCPTSMKSLMVSVRYDDLQNVCCSYIVNIVHLFLHSYVVHKHFFKSIKKVEKIEIIFCK